MIKINLAKKKSLAAAGVEGTPGTAGLGGKFSLDKLGIKWEDVKELPLKTIAFCIAASYFGSDAVEKYKEERLQETDRAVKTLQEKQNKLMGDLAKTKDYDVQKKQLEADEATLKGKIDAIQRLVSDRMALYNTMLAMASAIPPGVWLNDYSIQGDTCVFRGSSLDLNQISDFMKRLGETPHFRDISLKSTAQSKDSTGAEIATFDLSAKRR